MRTGARIGREARAIRQLAYRAIFNRAIYRKAVRESVVDDFHKLFYDSMLFGGTWQETHWMGVRVAKCPFDLWVYQEMLFELRPDLIVECGTADGGSAFFFSSICDLLDKGRVLTIDIEERPGRPQHERIRYLNGSSTSLDVLEKVHEAVAGAETVLVCLDSDHRADHVREEIRLYSPLVSKDSYLVVEDTNLSGNPVEGDFGAGPMEAVREFLAETDDFVVDKSREKFYLTFNPDGYLRKVS